VTEIAAIAARLGGEIPRMLVEHDIPALAIGIVDASGNGWNAAFGTTTRGGGQPVATTTMFSLQSCSKMYTATAVMSAVQAQLVELDRPVVDYLPEFTLNSIFESAPERQMTLRHLLSHTAGFTHEAPVGNNLVVGRASFAAHCRSISDTWLRFPVGHHYEYSNLGIDLAAFVIERVSGLPFHAFLRSHLLEPLGLDRTTFDQPRIARDRDRAIGHSSDAKRLPVRIPMVAAGGAYASIEDVCRFIQFHLRRGESLLSPVLLDEMYTVPFKPPWQRAGYGLGIVDAEWYRGHSGGGFGFLSDMYWAPEAGVGVAVLTNSDNHPLQQVLSERILRELGGAAEAPAKPLPARAEIPLSKRAVDQLLGQYVGRASTFSVAIEDGQLVMVSNAGKQPLKHVAPGEIALEEDPRQIWRVLFDEAGTPHYLVALGDGATWYRNDAPAETSPMPGNWTGTYHLRRMGGRLTRVTLGNDELGPFIRQAGEPRLWLQRHAPGLFFSTTGEALDMRRTPATYRNIPLLRAAERVRG
jgi:CubicO group peptidase (beta-lactamase class C family)